MMSDKEYMEQSNAVAVSLGIKRHQWLRDENGYKIAGGFSIELLEYVAYTPKPEAGQWIPEWVEICKRELFNRELEKIILKD